MKCNVCLVKYMTGAKIQIVREFENLKYFNPNHPIFKFQKLGE